MMDIPSLKDHLCLLEERLLNPDTRKSAEELQTLLADDFREFGSSGRSFDKQHIIEGLVNESPIQRTLTDFEVKLLSPDVVLATYRVLRHSEMKYSLRSSIWKLNEGQWQMVFHQGTLTHDN